MKQDDYLERIEMNPKVISGKLVSKGTRIPVALIMRMVAQGIPEAEILEECPCLELIDIRASVLCTVQMQAGQ